MSPKLGSGSMAKNGNLGVTVEMERGQLEGEH